LSSDDRLERILDQYYRLTGKEKRRVDKDLFETVEEVFDYATVKAILELVRKKQIYELKGVVSAGKEARVYWGKDFKGEDIAVKIYLTTTAEFRKGLIKYLAGDPRFEMRRIPKSTKKLMEMWANKEFRNYKLIHRAGVSVPTPRAQHKNILVLDFIGEEGVRAPLLVETELEEEEYERIFWNVLKDVRKMYERARLVHGDLSEFNIMVWQGKHYIIDVSQAVKLGHPNAEDFLVRDLRNLRRFFDEEVGLQVPELKDMYLYVTGEISEEELRRRTTSSNE